MKKNTIICGLLLTGLLSSAPAKADFHPILQPPSIILSQADKNCLVRNIYFEARGETLKGMVAVAQVTLTRVRRTLSSICSVVEKSSLVRKKKVCQFTWTCAPLLTQIITDEKSYILSEKAADIALASITKDITGGATHYHTKTSHPIWDSDARKVAEIGKHIFYKVKHSPYS